MEQIVHSKFIQRDFLYKHITYPAFSNAIPTHSHDAWELLFVKKGDVSYVVEGKNYIVPPNSLIISRPAEAHTILANSCTEYERYNFLFEEKALRSPAYLQLLPEVSVIPFGGNEQVCSLFSKADRYCAKPEDPLIGPILLNLVEEILYNAAAFNRDTDQTALYAVHPMVSHAIHYINSHIHSSISLEEICAALYISKSHLHHIFLEHLNITPKKYILNKKLQLAQRELRHGGHPTEVCSRYGFRNYSTFYRNYTAFFGVSPSRGTPVRNLDELL